MYVYELVEQLEAIEMVTEVYPMYAEGYIEVTTRQMTDEEYEDLILTLYHFGAKQLVPDEYDFIEYRIGDYIIGVIEK